MGSAPKFSLLSFVMFLCSGLLHDFWDGETFCNLTPLREELGVIKNERNCYPLEPLNVEWADEWGSSESICFLFAHANCVVCEIPVESRGRNYFLNFLINARCLLQCILGMNIKSHKVIALGVKKIEKFKFSVGIFKNI